MNDISTTENESNKADWFHKLEKRLKELEDEEIIS